MKGENMKDLRENIAKNISALRNDMGMTQLQLAEMLNYSDKAVSKWERGEAIPDVIVLKQIADYFGVGVDYLLEGEHDGSTSPAKEVLRLKRRNRAIITVMSISLAWLVAAIVFAVITLVNPLSCAWLSFVFALPASAVVWLVMNSVWGNRRLNFLIVTILLWSLIFSVYLSAFVIYSLNLWVLFIVGLPVQFLLAFLPGTGLFRYRAERKNK